VNLIFKVISCFLFLVGIKDMNNYIFIKWILTEMSINFYQSKNKSSFKNVFFARAGARREIKKAAL